MWGDEEVVAEMGKMMTQEGSLRNSVLELERENVTVWGVCTRAHSWLRRKGYININRCRRDAGLVEVYF